MDFVGHHGARGVFARPRARTRELNNYMKSKKYPRGGRRSSGASFFNPKPADERKTRQLCRQIHEQIDLTLSSFDNPQLQTLWVLEVAKTPFSSAMQVTLVAPDEADHDQLHHHIEAAKGRIRCEVAAAIHRKRTPHLRFVILPLRALGRAGSQLGGEPGGEHG